MLIVDINMLLIVTKIIVFGVLEFATKNIMKKISHNTYYMDGRGKYAY